MLFSKQSREKHPLAHLIPEGIWIEYFKDFKLDNAVAQQGQIPDDTLTLMSLSIDDLMKLDFSTHPTPSTPHYLTPMQHNQRTWLAIAFSHPELTDTQILSLAENLSVTYKTAIMASIYMKRKNLFIYTTNTSNHKHEWLAAAIQSAAELGDQETLNKCFNLAHHPENIKQAIAETHYKSIRKAILTNQPLDSLLQWFTAKERKAIMHDAIEHLDMHEFNAAIHRLLDSNDLDKIVPLLKVIDQHPITYHLKWRQLNIFPRIFIQAKTLNHQALLNELERIMHGNETDEDQGYRETPLRLNIRSTMRMHAKGENSGIFNFFGSEKQPKATNNEPSLQVVNKK